MALTAIKPCPHCGSPDVDIYRKGRPYGYLQAYWIFVQCDCCGAQSKAVLSYEDPEEHNWDIPAVVSAVKNWNRRANDGEK